MYPSLFAFCTSPISELLTPYCLGSHLATFWSPSQDYKIKETMTFCPHVFCIDISLEMWRGKKIMRQRQHMKRCSTSISHQWNANQNHNEVSMSWTEINLFLIVWISLVTQMVNSLPAMQETRVLSIGWKDPPEKGMVSYSSSFAWRIPWTKEPGGIQSMGSQRVKRLSD